MKGNPEDRDDSLEACEAGVLETLRELIATHKGRVMFAISIVFFFAGCGAPLSQQKPTKVAMWCADLKRAALEGIGVKGEGLQESSMLFDSEGDRALLAVGCSCGEKGWQKEPAILRAKRFADLRPDGGFGVEEEVDEDELVKTVSPTFGDLHAVCVGIPMEGLYEGETCEDGTPKTEEVVCPEEFPFSMFGRL
jgi:hypothetical protein